MKSSKFCYMKKKNPGHKMAWKKMGEDYLKIKSITGKDRFCHQEWGQEGGWLFYCSDRAPSGGIFRITGINA